MLAGLTAALLAVLLGVAGTAGEPAFADEEDPVPALTEEPPVALAITAVGDITAPVDGQFIARNTVEVSGTMTAGSTVTVTIAGGSGCTVAAADPTQEDWLCTVGLPNGPGVEITAVETRTDSTTQESTVAVDVLGPPTIGGASPQLTTGVISGQGYPGATITLRIGAGAQRCPAAANADGYWSCTIANPSGLYGVTASQSHPNIGSATDGSSPSGLATVSVDKDAPAAPVITSPHANHRVLTQPLTVSGTGENLGHVDVYVDGIPRCSATVSGATWSCAARGFTRGSHTIQAVLRDAAGNYAIGNSAPIRILFGAAPVKPAVPAPVAPDEAAPTPTPSPTSTTPTLPWSERPIFPGPDGRAPTLGEALTNWGSPTGFGAGLALVTESISAVSVSWAVLFALAFIALVALPLRLLTSTLRGRVHLPRLALTGRNRGRVIEDPVPRNPWLMGLIPLAATAGLIVLAEGMNGEVRYVRLLLAVGLGLSILNAVGVAVTARFASARVGISARLRFLPVLLLAAAVAALLSRWVGLDPPVVTGVLIGAGFALGMPARPRAIVSLAQVAAITALAVLGWLGHGLVGEVVGFWPSVLSETLATICLAGAGSALVLMLPVGPLPGRVILEWSARAWAAATVGVATITGLLLLSGTNSPFPILVATLMVSGFAAVCLAVWAWVNYVEIAG